MYHKRERTGRNANSGGHGVLSGSCDGRQLNGIVEHVPEAGLKVECQSTHPICVTAWSIVDTGERARADTAARQRNAEIQDRSEGLGVVDR